MSIAENFEEIINNFENIDKFGFLGLIGSINPSHDIDILSLRNPDYSRAEFIKANIELLKQFKLAQIRKGKDVIPFPTEYLQQIVAHVANKKSGDIMLHNLVYLDSPSFDRLNPDKFKEIIEKQIYVMHGDFKILNHPAMQTEHNMNNPYIQALNFQLILSNLPADLRTKHTKFAIKQITKNSLNMPEYHRSLPGGEWTVEQCLNEYSKTLETIDACEVIN
jgi:hypothetical protein